MDSAPRQNINRNLATAEIWILVSAWCSLSGWLLSWMGCLNLPGYCASFVAAGIFIFLWMKKRTPDFFHRGVFVFGRFKKRLRRPLPFIFLITAVLVFIGGAMYAPNNYDALTYRLPRIFHWLAEGRWHWIDTSERRMNYSATGFEWLMVPVFVFTRSDRFLFLINFLPFLLLPGLSFNLLTGLGIRPRVAWFWMWLLPMGHCFVMQAGGIGNDSFAAAYLLAAVCFALRASKTRDIRDLWIAALAAALLTGAKASNLPLLLPCAVAAWPSRQLLARRIPGTFCIALACLAVSFFPMAAMNQLHTGKWTGNPKNTGRMDLVNPVAGLVGNAMQLAVGNFSPPVFPVASAWNKQAGYLLKTPFLQKTVHDFPRLDLETTELSNEENAGAGIGLGILFLISLTGVFVWRFKNGAAKNFTFAQKHGVWIASGAWGALAVYMAKLGSESASRLVAAYYPLMLAIPFLHPSAAALVRKRWWKIVACLAALSALPAVVLTPSRPLWPALSIFGKLEKDKPGNRFLQRASIVYRVYGVRNDGLAPLRKYIPESVRTIGFVGTDDPQIALWRPYGTRRVFDVCAENEARVLKGNHISCLVASTEGIRYSFGETVGEWVASRGGKIAGHENITTKIARGSQDWYVLVIPEKGN